MKKIFYISLLLLVSAYLHAQQWSPQLFNNADVRVLKKVNNVCFAYGIDNSSLQGKLYRSDNNGTTWTGVDSTVFKFVYVNDITYDSTHSKYVICTNAQFGIFTSADGNTWTSTGTDWSGNAIAYISGRLVLSLANSPDIGIGISTDGGNSFFISNSGLFAPFYAHNITRINNTLYLALQSPTPVFISNNAGSNWSPQSTGLSNFANCFYLYKKKVYIGTFLGGVYDYNTKKSSWKKFNNGFPATSNIWTLASKGDSLYCGGDTIGVWLNTANVWNNFSNGLPAKITVRKLLQAGKNLFAATTNGLWKINVTTPQTIAGTTVVRNGMQKNDAAVKIYPTVTAGKITIQTGQIPARILLINTDGQTIRSWSNTNEIDISNVSNGIYFLNVTIHNKTVSQKIIKTN